MREIKFRAWDKNKEYMHYNVEDVYDDSSTENKPYLGDFFGGVLSDENMEVMQFTGLKDKNGKEIYEGDIVKVDCGDERLYIVEYVVDEGMSMCGFYYKRIGDGDYSETNSWNVGTVIIGNIYENPELIGRRKDA